MSKPIRAVPSFLRDRAQLLIAAGAAAESLEDRCAGTGLTVTVARDELAEIAEQMQRVVALLTATHLAEANAAKSAAEGRSVA